MHVIILHANNKLVSSGRIAAIAQEVGMTRRIALMDLITQFCLITAFNSSSKDYHPVSQKKKKLRASPLQLMEPH